MKTCPKCGTHAKDEHRLCMKCGESLDGAPSAGAPEPASSPATGLQALKESVSYLRELGPDRQKYRAMLPHPTGWVLGLGIPIIACLAVVHAVVFPGSAAQDGKRLKAKAAAEAKQQRSALSRCLARGRAQTLAECAAITGPADDVRRFSCHVARQAMEYGKCVAKATGKLGSCLGRCGQEARACTAACAGSGANEWSRTARCVMPCWKETLDDCVKGCF